MQGNQNMGTENQKEKEIEGSRKRRDRMLQEAGVEDQSLVQAVKKWKQSGNEL